MEKSTYIGLAIFAAILIGGLTWSNLNNETNLSPRTIQIDAKWFEFNPNEIRVREGEQITILVNNLDASHGIAIPDFGIKGDDMITFNADRKGEFNFYCNNFCGEGHSDMIGKIIVE